MPTGLELESPRDTGGGNQPPTAVAGGPYSGQEAISVNFNGSGSFDNNGDPLTYTWDFGDGTAGSGVSPSHAYAAAGSYSVSLVVNDGTVDSTASTTTATISIAGSNTPPVAAVGGPYSGVEGVAIGFDGSGSLDLDSDPLTYAWDFGDGSTGSGVSPSHAYVAAGSYTVELTVNDGTINSTISSTTATVNGAGGTGAFIQSGGADGLVIMEAENNDGNTAQGGHDWVEVFAPVGFVGASAFQAQPNNNTNNGGSGYALTAPRLDFQVTFSQTGTHYVFVRGRGDTGSDNSLHVGLDGLEVASASTISFASGAGWVYGSNGVKSLEVTTPGVHTINVWMREDGTYVDRILLTTNVSYVPTGLELESPRNTGGGNQSPTAVAGGSYSGVQDSAISFDGSGSFDSNGDPLTYAWDFGDGSTGIGVSPSHTYFAPGIYAVSLVVNDGAVDSTVSTTTVSVSGLGGSGAYQPDSATGLVSIEAEHEARNLVRNDLAWADDDLRSGFSGNTAVRASGTGSIISTGYSTTSPQMDYLVNFTQTGTYYVWLRGYADATTNNSVHVGLDGVEVASGQNIVFTTPASVYQWVGGPGVASIEVTASGIHTFNVWMRERNFIIDKIVLTPDANFGSPSGQGPIESITDGVFLSGLISENFNDGDFLGWTMMSESGCPNATAVWTLVNSQLAQIGDCNGYSAEGVATVTYALLDNIVPANSEIQLSILSDDPSSDGVGFNNSSTRTYDVIGLIFGYQDEDNYYRFELDGSKGHRKLWRKQGGVFEELNTSPQSYVRNALTRLRVIHGNGVILAYVDGIQVLAVEDSTFVDGKIGLICARNSSCKFDDVQAQAAPTGPVIGINFLDGNGVPHASSEYFVATDSTLDVSAVVSNASGVGGVEFVLDEGVVGASSVIDTLSPYDAQLTGLSTGAHTVTAYLLNSGGSTRLFGSDATVTLNGVGSSGIHLHVWGDSLFNGDMDDFAADNVSADGRNTGQGMAPVLNDFLSADNPVPVTVRNDGNPGETSAQGVSRIDEVLAHSPEAQAYLVMYGANDSGENVDSGLGLGPGQGGYANSFKDNLQQIIGAVLAEGKMIYLAKTPNYQFSASRTATIVQYNLVVDELIIENGFTYTPADLFSYFSANPGEFVADGIHMNGVGYQSMARIICQSLNGQMGLTCIP